MTSASTDRRDGSPKPAQRFLAEGQPRFPLFEQRRLAGVPPPSDAGCPPGALAIPGDIQGIGSTELVPETDAAELLTTLVRSTEDIILARIPTWAVQGVTTCILPKHVVPSWRPIEYSPVDKAETDCLRVADIQGKGKGCLAARSVPRGEPVGRERALLLMPRTCVSPQHFITAATNTMPLNQRRAFFGLCNCRSADTSDALGIISTNSFLIPGMPGHNVLYSAVFETFSRINHRCVYPVFLRYQNDNERGVTSCGPNAMFRWDHATFAGEIRALRPISAGEEVTVSYFHDIMGPAAVALERQRFLLECYNFECACSVCGRPSKTRSHSDNDRSFIFKSVTDIGIYYREMADDLMGNEEGDHARLINYLQRVKKVLDREMIFHPIYRVYLARALVIAHCAQGEAKAASKWAQRAAQHTRAVAGSDGGWDAIAKEPEKCEWWGAWNPARLGRNGD